MERKKQIKVAIIGMGNAANAALEVLNYDGRFDGSMITEKPVEYVPQIVKALQAEYDELEAMEPYKDFSPEELAEQKAQERKAALKKLQDEAAASLKAMKAAQEPLAVEESADEEFESEEDLEDDDQDLDEEETDTEPGEGEQLEGSADLEPVTPLPAEPVLPAAEPAKPAGKAKAAK